MRERSGFCHACPGFLYGQISDDGKYRVSVPVACPHKDECAKALWACRPSGTPLPSLHREKVEAVSKWATLIATLLAAASCSRAASQELTTSPRGLDHLTGRSVETPLPSGSFPVKRLARLPVSLRDKRPEPDISPPTPHVTRST